MKQAFVAIKQLVADFKAQETAYLSPAYQESQIRQDFIDKFFTALGWDVTHTIQKNPYQQEVHIENKVHMAGSQRRADYAFFLAPNFRDPKFFVEAKKPSRNLANPDDYYQTIRYGWNANTPIAILTDFEEFHILDCRFKPNIKGVMSNKIECFHYSDYTNEEKFSRIYWLISREAVVSGSLEKRVAELPKPRGKSVQRGLFKGGYQPVDEAFLEELDEYREVLAKAFKKSNPDLQSEELTEAVQRTIDRLVFIRFLEDKQIEEPEIINLRSKKSAWNGFLALCKKFDPKYNGLVFKPHKILDGKEFNPPDDEDFVRICDELADPSSPYNFDQIPISILGSIYERFLGKVVHATDKRVKVEEKPEVRKAGGVYYTPEYIVRYIVHETVGKLLYVETQQPSEGQSESKRPSEGNTWKTPEQVAHMSFADIACGSGSFLIEVYNQLLEYHIRYYAEHPEKQKEADVFERDGKLKLTLKKKKEILLNNIYGVDIDFQATEVTQLSLFLKMLEDVTMQDAHQFGMFKETILPDLRQNIVCGNSLIGTDIYDGDLFAPTPASLSFPNVSIGNLTKEKIDSRPTSSRSRFDINIETDLKSAGMTKGNEVDGGVDKLKPMNFEDVFPKVMKRGGFDAIVGNPPYIKIQKVTENDPLLAEELKKKYDSTKYGNYDLYVVFVEKCMQVTNGDGIVGYILPHKFFNSGYGQGLRHLLSKNSSVYKVIHFGDHQIFKGASTYTCLLFLTKKRNQCFQVAKLGEDQEPISFLLAPSFKTKLNEDWGNNDWLIQDNESKNVLNKINEFPLLRDIASNIFQGPKAGADDVFILEKIREKRITTICYSYSLANEVEIEKAVLRDYLKSKFIRKYLINNKARQVTIFPYDETFKLISGEKFAKEFPKAWSYINEPTNKKILQKREEGRFAKHWWCYSRPQNMGILNSRKILTPFNAFEASFALDLKGDFVFSAGVSGAYGILLKPTMQFHLEYLLGLLNSRLLFFVLRNISTSLRGGFWSFENKYLQQLPIRTINFNDPQDKSRHDTIVKLVEQMLEAKEKLSNAKTDGETNRLEMQCESLDRQIDERVYELYGLTKEEIKIVEGGSTRSP